MTSTNKLSGLQPISSVLGRFQLEDNGGRITREFQDYAYRLAVALDDLDHKSLYMRLAKNTPRQILEDAKSFVMDSGARSKARLFMWKVKQLKDLAPKKISGSDSGTPAHRRRAK